MKSRCMECWWGIILSAFHIVNFKNFISFVIRNAQKHSISCVYCKISWGAGAGEFVNNKQHRHLISHSQFKQALRATPEKQFPGMHIFLLFFDYIVERIGIITLLWRLNRMESPILHKINVRCTWCTRMKIGISQVSYEICNKMFILINKKYETIVLYDWHWLWMTHRILHISLSCI